MYNLGVSREFTANHYLIGGDWGEENVNHSHHYRLEVILEKKRLDQHGFLVDIVDVERHLDEVVTMFADKTLNTLPAFSDLNPSIERLATIIHTIFCERFGDYELEALKVTIWEDDIAWTSYHTGF